MRMRPVALLGAAMLLGSEAGAQSRMLIVSGLGGEPQYSDAFHEWAVSLAEAAERRMGIAAERVTVLTETPDRDPRRIDGRASRAAVLQWLADAARQARAGDAVFVVLFGHGNGEAEVGRLSLPGPDLTADDVAGALGPLSAQKVVIVNAASASGGFVERLSGRNRTIVTATQSPMERNETRFGGYFVKALTGDGADVDKDGRVSVLEAFDFARREVERDYREGNRMLTEHALLDDDGDGKGSREPNARSGDGSAARTIFFTAGAGDEGTPGDAPELRALRERQRQLEAEVEALKSRRAELGDPAYQQEMERLLLEIARTGQAIRARGGTR